MATRVTISLNEHLMANPVTSDTQRLFQGDWRQAPRHCGGYVETWDQTIGCAECQMNLWNLPAPEGSGGSPNTGKWLASDMLPEWAPEHLKRLVDEAYEQQPFTYEPFFDLFEMIHPFMFEDCHDPGDQDDGDWPGAELLLRALIERARLSD